MNPAPAAGPAAPGRFGPRDRVSFLAEQRRRRRQTWRLSLACAAAVLVTGLPLSAVLTPIAYAAVLGAMRLAGVLAAMPPAAREALRRQATLVPRLLDALGGSAHVPVPQAIAGALIVVAPGALLALLLWAALRGLLTREGAGAALLALGARPPRDGELDERQVADVAEEMAIAAGLPPPRVLVLDVPGANAAALGASPADAAIVVTRGLLAALDRAEKEAVVGHLIGSIGNGDLRVAVTVTSAFHSMALALVALEAVAGLSATAWRELFRTVRWALLRRDDAGAAEAVSEMLSREIGREPTDGLAAVLDASRAGEPRTALARAVRRFPPLKALLFPLYLPYLLLLFLRMEIFMLRAVVAGPLVMLVWRTRRYLADATAVQLTRDPEALARGLERLAAADTRVPRSQWASHLFVVGPSGREESGDGAPAEFGGLLSPHPSVRRRLRRLAAMGWSGAATQAPARPRLGGGGKAVLVVLGLLAAIVAALMAVALGLVFLLAGGAALLFAGAAIALLARFML
ncbi:MAG TPA: M48 family metalloprotease [Thermoanaerobaculaceae bacterium]|nr:M48 family metalloprotease [Thermoanaerobaculaceae bacterium]